MLLERGTIESIGVLLGFYWGSIGVLLGFYWGSIGAMIEEFEDKSSRTGSGDRRTAFPRMVGSTLLYPYCDNDSALMRGPGVTAMI